MKVKISKEEKNLIKAYVTLKAKQWGSIDEKDASSLEHDLTGMINNRNSEYRYAVEDYIIKLVENINK